MQSNVGGIDRKVRIAAGVVILGLGAVAGSWWGLVGLVPLITGVVGWCPPYALLGINTCSVKK